MPFLLDMWSIQKALANFIAKRKVEEMLVAFTDLTMQLASSFRRAIAKLLRL
jgi:hypothetical protein